MRKNIKEVIAAFQAKRPKGHIGDSISTDGKTIYSYTTPIYTRETGLNSRQYSKTTTMQQNAIRLTFNL